MTSAHGWEDSIRLSRLGRLPASPCADLSLPPQSEGGVVVNPRRHLPRLLPPLLTNLRSFTAIAAAAVFMTRVVESSRLILITCQDMNLNNTSRAAHAIVIADIQQRQAQMTIQPR